MHTIPFAPSDPFSRRDLTTTTDNNTLGVKEDAMTISQDLAVTPPEEPVNAIASEDCAAAEKPVVTPEVPKSTASVATASTTGEDPTLSSIDDGSVSSPLTPPRVHSVFPSKDQLMETIRTEVNCNRVLSLGRATANDNCINMNEVDAFAADAHSNTSVHSTNNIQPTNTFEEEEENSSQADSSDGESSYFAKNLPSPKSGRRLSYSSKHSAPTRTSSSSLYKGADNNRPSDASLSFSDESDDDELPYQSESPEPVSQLPNQVADMQIQRITRVHSVSSLVSSGDDASSHGHLHAGETSPNSTLSRDSYGSISDNAELSTVVASTSKHSKPFEGASPSGYTQASPPTILPRNNATGSRAGMLHPQPQMIIPGQLASWTASQQHNQLKMFGAGEPAASSAGSDGALPFVYSDDEIDDPFFMHQLAGSDGGYNNTNGPYNTYPNSHTGAPDDGFGGGGEGQRGTYGGKGNDGANQQPQGQTSYGYGTNGVTSMVNNSGGGDRMTGGVEDDEDDGEFQVYWRRWVMLFYMSILNLLSDWTCYSVAPIAILTQETFGDVDPERLVVIFLGANAIATACEPIILARLGLRKTVLFGSLLLMIGSMIKSGGIPPIIQAELVRGRDEWRLSFGFFLVGLSQPLYQCTPALLSASWFPERERTMATGVALNANQLGIGCAFVFGTLLVAESDDIPGYFSLLSIISTLCFLGTLLQFDDAPPTPPSSSAKVMKGDMAVPDMGSIVQSIRKSVRGVSPLAPTGGKAAVPMNKDSSGSTRRRSARSPAPAPSPALLGKTEDLLSDRLLLAPSRMMPGPVDPSNSEGARDRGDNDESPLYSDAQDTSGGNFFDGQPGGYPMQPEMPYGAFPPPPYQNPYMDPRMQRQPPYYQQQPYFYPPPPHPYYYGYQNAPPPPPGMYPPSLPPPQYAVGPYGGYAADFFEEGAEPIITVTDHHLDINIRDDQVILSIRTCLSRPGFIHALVAFTASGIVINTLSTYMDYLVTLNGAGREYVGIVGGSFQFIIMISSLIIGSQTDKTRAYYSVIIAMLVMGAFGLAECGVSLDADRGSDLRWSLLIVAALVGPLQPVSTELGVEVAYPLSENTVLVIQQLFSNLLSALFIPFFKSLRDLGISMGSDSDREHPQYTFSFYLLIIIHAAVTVFFATFNGRYLRYEHELEKEAKQEQKKIDKAAAAAGFYPVQGQNYDSFDGPGGECLPLND